MSRRKRSVSRRVVRGATPTPALGKGAAWWVAITTDENFELILCDNQEEAEGVHAEVSEDLEPGTLAILDCDDGEEYDDDDGW